MNLLLFYHKILVVSDISIILKRTSLVILKFWPQTLPSIGMAGLKLEVKCREANNKWRLNINACSPEDNRHNTTAETITKGKLPDPVILTEHDMIHLEYKGTNLKQTVAECSFVCDMMWGFPSGLNIAFCLALGEGLRLKDLWLLYLSRKGLNSSVCIYLNCLIFTYNKKLSRNVIISLIVTLSEVSGLSLQFRRWI